MSMTTDLTGPSVSERTDTRIREGLVDELMEQVRAEGIDMLGDGGLVPELMKRLLERALDEELTDHLGYERGDTAGRGTGNSRNGTTPKRLLTTVGPVDLATRPELDVRATHCR